MTMKTAVVAAFTGPRASCSKGISVRDIPRALTARISTLSVARPFAFILGKRFNAANLLLASYRKWETT
jgi:hypothetical protein